MSVIATHLYHTKFKRKITWIMYIERKTTKQFKLKSLCVKYLIMLKFRPYIANNVKVLSLKENSIVLTHFLVIM